MLNARRSIDRGMAAVAVAATAAAACGTSCGPVSETHSAAFCAVISDSIGLYVGNPVTQMGYTIGTIRSIKNKNNSVEVEFQLNEKRRIPQDVKAVVRSPSILADRSLELVGNYSSGPQLVAGDCIPPSRTFTPMSISRVIGSATNFVNAITPDGSTNIQDTLRGIDQAAKDNGAGINSLLTTSSKLLDNPDEAITDLGSITNNMAQLTSMLKANRTPLKTILQDAPITGSESLVPATAGAVGLARPIAELIQLVMDIETELGSVIQLDLDETGDIIRHLSPHYKALSNMLNPIPRFIGGLDREPPGAPAGALAKHINNHFFHLLTWRPPLFRIRTPNGLLLCGTMNASMPGSCADVAGTPYVVDVALLQYVLMQVQR